MVEALNSVNDENIPIMLKIQAKKKSKKTG